MTEALETAAGRRGWIISDGKAGNDVQTRGVFDALGLSYEVKRVDPRGIWAVLSPWGPVSPAERFGAPQSQFHPPWPDFAISIGRLTTPYIRRLKRAAGLATYTIILQNPKVPRQDGRPLLGAGARHAARAERDHDADGAAQLHRKAPGRAAGEHAAADRRAAAAARGRAAGRAERGFSLHAGGAGAARRGAAVARPSRGRADDHAVAADAGGDRRVRARGDGKARRASSGTGRARIPIRNSWRMPMPSSRLRTPST